MEIIRKRTSSPILIKEHKVCSKCRGRGIVERSQDDVISFLENQLKLLLNKQKLKNLTICVHPYVYAALHRGFFSKKWEWILKYWQWFNIVENNSLSITDYYILNGKKQIIAVNPSLVRPKDFTDLSI